MTPTTPADASPAAGEVVAWRFQWLRLDGTPTSDGWHLSGEKPTLLPTVATVVPLVLKSFYDAMRAERDEANARADAAERETGRQAAAFDSLAGARNKIVNKVWELVGGQDESRRGGCNLVGRAGEVIARAEAAESKLAETAAELVRVREMLGKAVEALRVFAKFGEDNVNLLGWRGKNHLEAVSEKFWPSDFNAARAILAEIEEGKSP